MKRTLIPAMVLVLTACDTGPSPVPAERDVLVVTPPPPMANLTISGNAQLSSAGETCQLTVTARFADGSTRDVTSESDWSWSDGSIATVSASGLLTASRLGLVYVTARYPRSGQSLFGTLKVIITPPGTLTLAGRVREPGTESPGDVRVTHIATGQSLLTRFDDGTFNFGGVTSTRLSFTKLNYEPVEIDGTPNDYFEVPLQKVYRISPNATSMQILVPSGLEYEVSPNGPHCRPCHLVRLTTPNTGKITVRAAWGADGGSALSIWMNGQEFQGNPTTRELVADLTVNEGETVLFLGRRSAAAGSSFFLNVTLTTGAVTSAER